MKIIDREMTVKETVTDKSKYPTDCQASFNSDGVITLRNYNTQNKDSDEIIILSAEETHAIIGLFSRFGRIMQNNQLPY